MRQVLIVSNNPVFQTERRRARALPAIDNDQLPAEISILVGKRSLLFGGGPTRRGYVMHAGRAIGTTAVKLRDVKRGAMMVPV
jgi:hypothetical protein